MRVSRRFVEVSGSDGSRLSTTSTAFSPDPGTTSGRRTGPKSRPPRWWRSFSKDKRPLFNQCFAAGLRVETRSGPGTPGPGRPIWTGTISFGLVSVPVRMFPATQSKELRFPFLDRKDLTPIAYEKVRRDDREPVDPDEIVRGFEIERGRYVPLEDEDLDRLDIELAHSIDICDFVDLEDIDPVYFRKAYYLMPSEGAEKPYRLLVRALDETGRVAIAKVKAP